MSEEPNSIDLKCYFLRAQLAQGSKDVAWEGAGRLWVGGKSQPGACDPLFEAWQDAGGVTNDVVWTRLLNAFDAREESLLQYVARKSSVQMRPQVDQQLELSEGSTVEALSAVARIEELKYHQNDMLAHSEWYKLLQDTDDVAQQQDLALLATQKGWYRMAIDAATRAQAWDSLDQRFPIPYQDIFKKNAALRQVPSTELMAIARRESAFFAGAQSLVGARGLMQIMPATGKAVASSR